MDIDAKSVREYYLRPEILERMFEVAEGREVVPVFAGGMYGKRPSSVQFIGDFEYMAKKGATSFHCSVEHWTNPLLLSNTMKQADIEKIRTGWDMILDIDANEDLEHGKIAAHLIIDALSAHSIKNISLKFSGRRGFHIGVPCKSLPEKINFRHVRALYPELMQKVADYLRDYIRENLVSKLANYDKTLDSRMSGDPYKILEVEHNWSVRHLFRMPYSFNEKTWRVSMPIDTSKLSAFKIDDALPQNVKGDLGFLENYREDEALDLFMEAMDHTTKDKNRETKGDIKREKIKGLMRSTYIDTGTYIIQANEKIDKDGSIVKQKSVKAFIENEDIKSLVKKVENLKIDIKYGITDKISEEFFPPCINNICNGLKDGRKRALFILVNFLRSVGWDWKDIEDKLKEWNNKNPEPLNDSHIKGHLNYAKKAEGTYLPPNCENKGYYQDILICSPDNFCSRIRNPVNYALQKSKNVTKSIKKKESTNDVVMPDGKG